jgi:hypothetical protein
MVYNNFIKIIPETSMPLPSYIFIMIVAILLEMAQNLIYSLPLMSNWTMYEVVIVIFGLFLGIFPMYLRYVIIGVPCAYLDKLVSDLTENEDLEEDEIRKVVQDYRKFKKLSSPYLFLIYTSLSCLLVLSFYNTGIQQVCIVEKVNILFTFIF